MNGFGCCAGSVNHELLVDISDKEEDMIASEVHVAGTAEGITAVYVASKVAICVASVHFAPVKGASSDLQGDGAPADIMLAAIRLAKRSIEEQLANATVALSPEMVVAPIDVYAAALTSHRVRAEIEPSVGNNGRGEVQHGGGSQVVNCERQCGTASMILCAEIVELSVQLCVWR